MDALGGGGMREFAWWSDLPRTRGAGIHDQGVPAGSDQRLVRVAVDNHVRAVSLDEVIRRRTAGFVPVTDVDLEPLERQADLLRQAEDGVVRVAEYRVNGRDPAQFPQHSKAPDVAGMQDRFDPVQGGKRLSADERVRI